MSIAINSLLSATVPFSGTNSPVVDLGESPGAISTAVALADAGSVVLSLPGAPRGAVTYTAAGLLHQLAIAGTATSRPSTPTEEKLALNQGILSSLSNTSSDASNDGVYNGSGVFTPNSSISANFANALSSNPGLVSVAVSDSFAQGAVGTLVSTTA